MDPTTTTRKTTKTTAAAARLFAGVDLSKDRLDVCLRWSEPDWHEKEEAFVLAYAGRSTGLRPHVVKGVMPTHATPSKVSMARGSGIKGRSERAGTGQCIKSSPPQDWYMIGRPGGRARTERRSTSAIGSLSIFSNSLHPHMQAS